MALALSAPPTCFPQATPPALEPLQSSITVVERVTTQTPVAVTTLNATALRSMPGVNLDDRLRLVPGFSLFRRTSSLAANPTTQGVSLRGLGSTGASRTLILWDGVPMNDPFGGWVYWTRIAPDDLDRVELSRGASTSVFGDKAMGGAISLFSREPVRRRANASYEGGNLDTHQATAGGSVFLGSRWALSGQGRAFTTNGYYLTPQPYRGPIDTPANARFAGGAARVDYLGSHHRFFTRLDMLSEERDNGTQLQRNSTGLGTLAGHYTRELSSGLVSALGYHTRTEYRASFSAIGAGRLTERLTMLQSVPAQASGGALLWQVRGSLWNATLGADLNRAEGYSLERIIPTGRRVGGGVQTQHGLFAQGDTRWRALRLHGGLRRQMAGNREFWSPSAGATLAAGSWRFRASGYRAFRAPTLNELFREFRVGNAVTLANPALRPESLTGVEAGADWRGEHTFVSFTLFRNDMSGLITNVTRSVTPQLITRQRDNAASALVQGVEATVRQTWRNWRAEASWLLADSRFAACLRVPQIPKNQGSAQLFWTTPGTFLSGGLRSSSLQLEDDLNLFRLPGFAVWHFTARQRVTGPLSVIFAVENAFNRDVLAGFSPTPALASPRVVRAGIRLDWE